MLINLPYKILIEENIFPHLDEFLKSLKIGERFSIICGERVKNILENKIEESISSDFDFNYILVDDSAKEEDIIKKISNEIIERDFVIGLGGGRNIDIAKYSAFLSKKPWIAFPTVLSHDGVVSSRASISSNGKRISKEASEPIAIIGDLETIKKAPYRHIASGYGDLISNITAVEDWKIASKKINERFHTTVAELSLLSARSVMAHTNEIKEKTSHGMEILLWSLICSGFAMNIYGSSRPCSGSEHNFSHALDELGSNALHGEQCALGSIIMGYLQGIDWKLIKEKMIEIGLPTNSKEIGIEEDILVKALVNAKNVRDRYTILNEIEIDEKKAREILKEVEII